METYLKYIIEQNNAAVGNQNVIAKRMVEDYSLIAENQAMIIKGIIADAQDKGQKQRELILSNQKLIISNLETIMRAIKPIPPWPKL